MPDVQDPHRPPAEPPPSYTRYRAGPRVLDRLRGPGLPGLPGREPGRGPTVDPAAPRRPQRRAVTPKRVILWLIAVVVGWLVLSLVLFLISAQLQRSSIPDDAKAALAGNGTPPFSPTTILVLGSDLRPKGSREPGAQTSGPSRSDVMMLMRVGGGHNARLSIPRDTIVPIPGHGTAKINAAMAYGGPGLAIRTVESFLGVKVDHLVQVSFTNFPQLIDAMGGVNVTTGCVRARVDGGYREGGVTLRLRPGTHHLDGKQALALARVRENACNPTENELTRERRQQQLISAMKSRLLSPTTFLRLPWVSWAAPKALQTDMGGPSLLGLFASLATTGSPPTRVLLPDLGFRTLPDGGQGLAVSDAEKRREVAQLLDGG